ncbi:GNAT family N-acetyltransferase [Anaeromicropila populeti]|uniref:Protein N-acetyltransferase, RimJ/RimL family n=1 Tax=Anaeromicropila populeti TaxID=37658 RepID=A0A1I6JH03_9FIRM|nr:GNAT family N-acetyltransferase [Anaeromicropila populeti]SFR78255.1 Protein N-acetyltransferase, RimJ/RimL family [Anaeromicropila populeti]
MTNVYEECPLFENNKYLLRYVRNEDCKDLLKVYSDEKSVPLFNSDNCEGDDFYYTTYERMEKAIEYWHFEYDRKGFVRWSIVDQTNNSVIGTIELFHRKANDYFTECGLLRLDLRSDYEKETEIESILSLIIKQAYDIFNCDKVATKAKSNALERVDALEKMGFRSTTEKLKGHDGTEYDSYYVIKK